jgi:hypothetical protein
MIAQLPNLDTILKRHAIQPKFWPEFHGLVEEGERPSKELRTRLGRVTNYKAAFNEILAELSKTLDHKFPPADYQPPVQYESLSPEDILTEDAGLCAGAPSVAR